MSARSVAAAAVVLFALLPVGVGAQPGPADGSSPTTGAPPPTGATSTTSPATTSPASTSPASTATTSPPVDTTPPATAPPGAEDPATEPGATTPTTLSTPTTTAPPDVTPPTLGLHVTHPHFSPNGDRVREKAFFRLTATEPVVVDIVIRNASGTARKTRQIVFGGPGQQTVTWGGRIERRGTWGRAPDGDYTVKFVARDAAGNAKKKTRTVTVDTRAPRFTWSSITPDPWGATGAVSFNFTTSDASPPLRVYASASSREGLLDRSSTTTRPRGATRLAWRPDHSDGSVFLPGNYFGAVRLTDDAGNAATSPFRAFRVDRSVTSVVVRRVESAGRRVALTFDDCNEGAAWDSILSSLRAYGVRATFFCPGDQVYAHPGQARATVAAGHTVGSHSADHAQLTRLSYSSIMGRLATDKAAWWSVARAVPTPYFRPPYGSYNSTVLAAAGSQGFRYTVIWDVDTNDWQSPGASTIASRVLGSARPGSIVLLHVKSQTAAALPAILAGLRARGLQASSLGELFRANGWH
ncbi:MAG: polysaccharide deacetylase family protein [Acidimicrobiales bacterium]|nr:polysaccharide deacetylase family protein [Acidimicrobiales bacterium]